MHAAAQILNISQLSIILATIKAAGRSNQEALQNQPQEADEA